MVEAAGWNVRRAVTMLRSYMVEAAGIEPCCIVKLNLLMAHGFGGYRFGNLELPRRFDSP
jgi:hypothetical protein